MSRQAARDEVRDLTGEIAVSWLEAKLPLPLAVFGNRHRCDVDSCRSIPFVTLKTTAEAWDLCLCHFQAVKDRTKYLERQARLEGTSK